MKNLKEYMELRYITEAIKPPRLSAKNKHLWRNGLVDEEEIMKWLEENCICNGGIDINGGVIDVNDVAGIGIKEGVCEFPYSFGYVKGSFDCSDCIHIASLNNAPKKVGRHFVCNSCTNLKSLEGAPQEVGKDFNCAFCFELKSLKGAPEKVGRNFSCSHCANLTSLKGAPKYVGGNFYCYSCGEQFTEDDVRKVCNVKGRIYV